jgi:hypothetical protein
MLLIFKTTSSSWGSLREKAKAKHSHQMNNLGGDLLCVFKIKKRSISDSKTLM